MATAKKAAAKKPAAKAPAAKKPVAKKAAAKPAADGAAKTAVTKAAPAAKKAAAAKAPAEKKARTPNAAFMKALTPSAELASVVGQAPLPRTEVIKKLWEYIKKANLQDPANKRMINADDKLTPIFGKSQVTMFELTKLVSKHLS